MKINVFKATALSLLTLGLFITQGCKKEDKLPATLEMASDKSGTLATNALTAINVVSTVAGAPNSPGLADGAAKTARFNLPLGIYRTKDGTIYIADNNNNAIRKLTADGNVTTLVFKTPQFYGLQEPTSVGVDDAGNVHVLSYLVDQAGLTYTFDKNGNFVAGYESTYTAHGALAKDPYEDFFWFSRGRNILKHIVDENGGTGRDDIPFDKSLLTEDEQRRGQTFRGLFVGRNRVIYFSTETRLFKYTPSGVTAQLYPNLDLGGITSIVLNADSRTMYLAAHGKILKIENSKLTVLAGPNSTTPDGRDGVGQKADVHAYSLALGDHENSLYFSDNGTHTIRKLMLK